MKERWACAVLLELDKKKRIICEIVEVEKGSTETVMKHLAIAKFLTNKEIKGKGYEKYKSTISSYQKIESQPEGIVVE